MSGTLFRNIVQLDATPALEGEVEGLETTFIQEEADVLDETDGIEEETSEIDELGTDINSASDDHEELEGTVEVLEEELADPNFEGTEEVTALSYRTSLALLRNKHSLSFPHLEGKITKQSFTGISRTTNIDRSRAVLAGFKDALVELWEKIKAGLKLMWDKVKAMWSKHFSTIGRLKKSFDSAAAKAKAIKGTPDFTKEVKAGSLSSIFQNGSKLDVKIINEELLRVSEMREIISIFSTASLEMGAQLVDAAKSGDASRIEAFTSIFDDMRNKADKLDLGSENEPFIGGWYATIESEKSSEGGVPKLSLNQHTTNFKGEEGRLMDIASKDQLVNLFNTGSKVAGILMKHAKETEAVAKNNQKTIELISNAIANAGDDADKTYKKNLVDSLKMFQRVSVIEGKIDTKYLSLVVRGLKGALAYGKKSMSAYKKA